MIFLYQLTNERGLFDGAAREHHRASPQDRRLQLLLVAFCFGAFFEGAAGFGTPVAVTGAMLIGLGFTPLAASGLSLIANTAPVAFGALGTPIIALQSVTGLDLLDLSAMVGRQLPFFSLIVPFWLVWAFAGFAGMLEVWPAVLVAGVAFAVPQFLVSNYPRAVAGRHRRRGGLDGRAGALPARLAAGADAGGSSASTAAAAPRPPPTASRRSSSARGCRGSS